MLKHEILDFHPRAYRETYRLVRCSPAVTEQEFSFSETHVFGRFDAFCARIRKILIMFDLIQDYQTLFERRMEGLLLGEGVCVCVCVPVHN